MEQNKFKSKNFLSPSLTDGISRSLTSSNNTQTQKGNTVKKGQYCIAKRKQLHYLEYGFQIQRHLICI